MLYSRTVYFQETDAAGVVYFANVMAMCHEAYEASLIRAGIDLKTFFKNPDFAIPIVRAEVDYRRPIFCGDRLQIHLFPRKISQDTFEIDYQICSTEKPETRVAVGLTKHVSIHPSSRRRQPFPEEINRWLAEERAADLLKNLDAVAIWNNGKAYFFRGDEYWSYDVNIARIDRGYPQKINRGKWKNFPPKFRAGIRAAVVLNNGKALFFKENQYIRYDLESDRVDPGYPQTLDSGNWPGWPPHFYGGIDTGFRWDNKIYIFKGDEYIRYDLAKELTDLGYPQKINGETWPGLPPQFASGIEVAFPWRDGRVYFFKGDEYICYNMSRNCPELERPQKVDFWLSWERD